MNNIKFNFNDFASFYALTKLELQIENKTTHVKCQKSFDIVIEWLMSGMRMVLKAKMQ